MTNSDVKAFVLEAFETLFNRRDYLRAENFWSPHYIQHSAHIAPGRAGLFDLVRAAPPELRYENRTRQPGMHLKAACRCLGRIFQAASPPRRK